MKETCPKVVIDRRTRLNRRRNKMAYLRIQLTILILIMLAAYIIIQGVIVTLKQILNKTVYAPSSKVYAQVIIPTPTPITLNPDIPERDQNIFLIKKIWGKDQEIGLKVAFCESGYRTVTPHTLNTNETFDQGVFQINTVHKMPEMENAVANISYAYAMYLNQGLAPWESSKHCWNK